MFSTEQAHQVGNALELDYFHMQTSDFFWSTDIILSKLRSGKSYSWHKKFTNLYVYVGVHVHVHATHTLVCIHVCACMHVGMHAFVCVSMHICILYLLLWTGF